MSRCEMRLQLINATVTAVGETATLEVVSTPLIHEREYHIRYCVTFGRVATGAEDLSLIVGANTYPILTRNGQTVKVGMLRRRELLCLRYINPNNDVVPAHFVLLQGQHNQALKVQPPVV